MSSQNGDDRARTDDLYTASVALSQLSYAPATKLIIAWSHIRGKPFLYFFLDIKLKSRQSPKD